MQFAKIERISDITLGDFWGCDDVMPNVLSKNDRQRGVSLILVNHRQRPKYFGTT